MCVLIHVTQDIHIELEAKIARFHGRDDAILYASCFDANAGMFEVLMGKTDAIFSDQLNHASIIDGIRLAKTQKYKYKHKGEWGVLSPLHNPNEVQLTSPSPHRSMSSVTPC